MTVWADTTLLAASGITRERGLSMTSSLTIMLRLTGRQCMEKALSVRAIFSFVTVHERSRLRTLP